MKNVLFAVAFAVVSVVAYGDAPTPAANTEGTQSVLKTSNETTQAAATQAAPAVASDCCCTTKCVTLSPWQTRRLVRQAQREEIRDVRQAQREELRACRCSCATVAVETCKCKKTCCCN